MRDVYLSERHRGYLRDYEVGEVVRPHEHPEHVDLKARMKPRYPGWAAADQQAMAEGKPFIKPDGDVSTAMSAMSKAMYESSTLRCLDMSWCMLDRVKGRSLFSAELQSGCPALSVLRLSNNPYLGDGCIKLLASMLGQRSTSYAPLLELDLRNTGMAESAGVALADALRGLETRGGNWPSSLPDARAKLVHFCHGAPGVVFAMAEAYRVYGDDAFRDACLRGAETVWHFGLLTKGPGLCHGVAGNGYALLAAYRVSRDPSWLHRAVVFGTCIGDDGVCARQRTPDNPYSLFEGLAGSGCFLRDLRESRFFGAGLPLYEVDDVR